MQLCLLVHEQIFFVLRGCIIVCQSIRPLFLSPVLIAVGVLCCALGGIYTQGVHRRVFFLFLHGGVFVFAIASVLWWVTDAQSPTVGQEEIGTGPYKRK